MFGLIVMPVGAEAREKVSALGGLFGSVAEALALIRVSSLMVRSAGTVRLGGRFDSVTETMKELMTLSDLALIADWLKSVALTRMTLVVGLWDWLGVQVIRPLAESMVMPVGAETSAKVRAFAGRSLSVAEALTLKVVKALRV